MKLLGTLCLAGALAISANAATIFDNITQPVTGQDGIRTGGTDANGNAPSVGPIYDSFSTGTSANNTGFNLDNLKLSLLAGDNTSLGSVSVGLYADGGAGTPGSLIANLFSVADTSLVNCDTSAGICTGTPVISDSGSLTQLLADNTTYWIGLSTDTSTALWNYEGDGSGTGTLGEFYYNLANGSNSDVNGPYLMQINTSDNPADNGTPEPATLALFGGGMLALGFIRRKARKN